MIFAENDPLFRKECIRQMTADPSNAPKGRIRSEFVSFTNREGLELVACIDCAEDKPGKGGWVVMAPKFGETKKNGLQLAYSLAANGLNVLRFDHSNHVGESGGDQNNFTLASGAVDILSCGDFLEKKRKVKEYTLLANSLSARTAVRAAAQDPRVSHLVCLVGVVNLTHTLHQVYCEDLVGGHLNGRTWGVGDMLGVEMDYDNFLKSSVRDNMHDLAGTRADLLKTSARISFYAGDKDRWVEFADVEAALRDLPNARLTAIPGAMHELRENPQVAERAFRMIVTSCVAHVKKIEPEALVLQQPDKRELLQQNRLERERLRQAESAQESETEFWTKYLAKYRLLQNVDDYQDYVGLVGRLLGPIKPGEIVLDAGCGNGLFGLWVVRTLLEKASFSEVSRPPVYIGLDLTAEGLRDAISIQSGCSLGHPRTAGERFQKYLGMIYGQTDLDEWGLAPAQPRELVVFANDCFDKVCCSLVLSYLNQPQRVLEELHRVLKPGAAIVVSSMKPFCDMSEIYRDFMSQQVSADELESGRDLLRAAGRIRLKEEQGFYTFFSAEELTAMLVAAGFKQCQGHVSFGGQAAVVAAEK